MTPATQPSAVSAPALVLEPLNPQQRAAAQVVRGPLCILAGAGTGKTTTVTHRIAYQVASGAFDARDILAVTFTRKAAGELRERLAGLGVSGVESRTIHSAAGWMLRFLYSEYEGRQLPSLLPSRYTLVAPLARRLPRPYCFRPVRDLVSALEWGANRRLAVADVCSSMEDAGVDPPLPADLLDRLSRDYEDAKARNGCIDYEDMLRMCAELLEQHTGARERIQQRFRSITVDEYQDINPLQQWLLDLWLGDRDDICVVGDDHQTIYSFTGARSSYLTGFAHRHPDAAIVRLEDNYRSTPQVIEVAERVSARLPGVDKQLRATREPGPVPEVVEAADAAGQAQAIAQRVADLTAAGIPYREIAVLYRTNAQSATYEQGLAAAGIPVFVRGRGLLERDAWRQLTRCLGGEGAPMPAERVADAARSLGWSAGASVPAGSDEETRQRDFDLLVSLALTAGPSEDMGDLVRQRFGHENDEHGVQLMSIHSAKGLEYEAVFLPELEEGVLPFGKGKRRPPLDEERRLFFVAVTRARRHLWVGWSTTAKKGPSSFLVEAGLIDPPARTHGGKRSRAKKDPAADLTPDAQELYESLRRWRRQAADGKPAYVVFSNRTLAAIASATPTDADELLACHGVGDDRLYRYGEDVLRIVREHAPANA